jgi:CBS domain-containing protein
MKVADLCNRNVRVAYPDQPLAEAARVFCEAHVGALPVVRRDDPKRHPIGMVTDRDAVRGQLRHGQDLFCLMVEDVMSRDPCTIAAGTDAADALLVMSERSVRRAPVLDATGALIGIVSLDDLLPQIARDLESLAHLVSAQRRAETRGVEGARQ